MRAYFPWMLGLVLVGAALGGCGDDVSTGGGGGGGTGRGVGGEGGGEGGGAGGEGGGLRLSCGAEGDCEAQGLLCYLSTETCVECLAAADCADGTQTCANGSCEQKSCISDEECPDGEPRCTLSGCAPCMGEAVTDDDREGDCYAARGPNGDSPKNADGCSADAFLDALEKAGYNIPSEENEEARQAIKDNPLKHVTAGVCSVPFGNAGQTQGACELHDYCYSVCGSSRARCDLEFAERLLGTCRTHYLTGPCLTACATLASIYATAVATASDQPYLHDQGIYCECCPDQTTCGDGTCDVNIGETVDNCGDCTGDLPNGASCITGNDCASDHCSIHGECAPYLCVTNNDCPSNICNWGVCLARGLETGSNCSTNKACASGACTLGVCLECANEQGCPASEHCNLFGQCIADLGNNAVCTAHAECLSGICSVGLCAECVSDDGCGTGKHCDLFGDCKNNLGNNAVCTANRECTSNICSAGLCAQCVRDSQCVASKHCNLFGDCINDLNNGSLCTANAECKSGTCAGICVGF